MVLIEAGCDGRPGLATLETSDTEAVAGLFNRLSPESIYRRFFSPIAGSDHFCASILRMDSFTTLPTISRLRALSLSMVSESSCHGS